MVCLTDLNYPSSNAFEFLNQSISSFRKQFKEDEIREAYSYSFNNSFKKQIKSLVCFYNNNLDSTDLTNLDRLKDSLLDSKYNLVETLQTLHLREERLSHSVEKAEELIDNTDELLINARKAKKAEISNSPYKILKSVIIIVFVVYFIMAIMCGGVRLSNCSI